jgi:hypothetical protein
MRTIDNQRYFLQGTNKNKHKDASNLPKRNQILLFQVSIAPKGKLLYIEFKRLTSYSATCYIILLSFSIFACKGVSLALVRVQPNGPTVIGTWKQSSRDYVTFTLDRNDLVVPQQHGGPSCAEATRAVENVWPTTRK